MKTTFRQYLQEASSPPAALSASDLHSSLRDGKFTKDGSHLKDVSDFYCHNYDLVSLDGVPLSISGNFYCAGNRIMSLEGCPQDVGGYFSCRDNYITSLEGAPTSIKDYFNCSNNLLTSLEGVPKVIGSHFYCECNNLASLKDIHKHIHQCDDGAFFRGNPIKSHVLGLLKIKNLKHVALDNNDVADIIDKYLPEGDMFACQQELIDAGFEEYAQL